MGLAVWRYPLTQSKQKKVRISLLIGVEERNETNTWKIPLKTLVKFQTPSVSVNLIRIHQTVHDAVIEDPSKKSL